MCWKEGCNEGIANLKGAGLQNVLNDDLSEMTIIVSIFLVIHKLHTVLLGMWSNTVMSNGGWPYILREITRASKDSFMAAVMVVWPG